MPSRIGRPMTRSSTRNVGDSMIAARRPCPSSADFHSLTFLGLPVRTGAAVAMRSLLGPVTGRRPWTRSPPPHAGRFIRATDGSLAGDLLQLGLELLERVSRALGAGQGGVRRVLDGGGGVAVADDLGSRHGVVDRVLERRQVGELLHQGRVVVEGGDRGGLRGQLEVLALAVLAGHELDELQRALLVLGVGGDGEVVATEAGCAGTVEAGERGDGELALDLRALVTV